MPRTPPLNALKVLEAAARHLSFKKAAQELHVTPTAVSHQVGQLEDLLGVVLFKRVNQGIELTAAARACLPSLQEGMACLREAVELMQTTSNTRVITVTAAPSFASCWLMPRLHRFTLANPQIDVRVATQLGPYCGSQASRMGDFNIHAWAAESDVVLIYGSGHYPELKAERLLPLTITPLCAPQALQGAVPLTEPQALAHHTLLHDGRGTQTQNKSYWHLWSKAMGLKLPRVDDGPQFAHALLALNAAADGFGVVASTPQLAATHLENGRLIAPFELEIRLDAAYFIVCSKAAYGRDDVAMFRAWLHAESCAVRARTR